MSNTNNIYLEKEDIIAHMENWCVRNGLLLNITKSKIMCLNKRLTILPELSCDLDITETYKYLGIIISNNLSWDSHVTYITKVASSRLYALRIVKNIVTIDFLVLIYKSIIQSILDYCTPTLCHLTTVQRAKLLRIQRRAHNIICYRGCDCTILEDFDTRRTNLCSKFFTQMLCPSHPLHSYISNDIMPSGRLIVHFANTTKRQNSFIYKYKIQFNLLHVR